MSELRRGRHLPIQLDRLGDDAGQAAADGLAVVRFDLVWPVLQPSAGRLDGGAVEAARSAIQIANGLGLDVWVRLLQREVPAWFDNEGGFADQRASARWWPRWIEAVADAFGDVVDGWVPIEAPFRVVLHTAPGDARAQGEVLDHLVVAWRDAWRILRGGPPVSASLDVAVVRPQHPDSQPAIDAARREDTMRWFTWLHGLSTGEVVIPGRADRELADLAGSCDLLGIVAERDPEGLLHRTAEMGPDRPLALTFRVPEGSPAQRAEVTQRMWATIEELAGELPVRQVIVA